MFHHALAARSGALSSSSCMRSHAWPSLPKSSQRNCMVGCGAVRSRRLPRRAIPLLCSAASRGRKKSGATHYILVAARSARETQDCQVDQRDPHAAMPYLRARRAPPLTLFPPPAGQPTPRSREFGAAGPQLLASSVVDSRDCGSFLGAN